MSADLAAMFEQVRGSVVSIRAPGGNGSGFCATGAGVIVTNAHVVGYARHVQVRVPGGEPVPGTVFAVDMRVDLALVAMPGAPPPLVLADGASVRVGQRVLAVGDPAGLPATATQGIVSAVARRLGADGASYVQTDAPINHGNSGGPLLDESGRVIGVNTLGSAVLSGVAFAVRVDDVRRLLAPYAAALPEPLPEPRYGCRTCEQPHTPHDQWCTRCGLALGFASGTRNAGTAALADSVLAALGFDAAKSRVAELTWRLDTGETEVWVDVVGEGRGLVFSARLGRLPVKDPLPVLRFVTAANDRSVGACRIVLDGDTVVIETLEPVAFADADQLAVTLGQLVALAGQLGTILRSEFDVRPPIDRFTFDQSPG
jgi:hypothetical protein